MALTYLSIESSAAQTIESFVMPGPVTEAHAETETECSACHAPFSRGQQRQLCLDCHEDVGIDIEQLTGFHGKSAEAKDDRCATCHTDHEGRDFDIVILNETSFDHELTDFPLLSGHQDMQCASCHAAEERHRDAPMECISCHLEDDIHDGFTSEQCDTCHRATEWVDVVFDHDATDYPLLGKHQDAVCTDCHEDKTFRTTPTACFDCHASDDSHNGRSGQQCENCHKPTDWNDSSFDHRRDTTFELIGKHDELSCNDCHSDDPFADNLEMACVSCHLEDDNHDAHFGDQCNTCHTPHDFERVQFDHDADTNHPLIGAHEEAVCESCHIEPIYEVALEQTCNACHSQDDPHAGEQGVTCQGCHNEFGWQDDVFFDHDLTRFPLLGRHAEEECDTCHESHVFSEAPDLCVNCHREENPHQGRFYEDCAACHNPVDWLEWSFDHNTTTRFVLDGAHLDVQCDDCHRQPLSTMWRIGSRCGDCHRGDDIHDGEFGANCGRCHSADNFTDVTAIQ